MGKVQYIFDRYVEAVDKLGKDFSYAQMIPYLDKALVKAGLDLTPTEFAEEVCHELETNKDWSPSSQKVNAYLNSLPNGLLKDHLSDTIITSRLNSSLWLDYRDLGWVKSKKAVAFLVENNLHDKKPVTIVKKGKNKSFTVSVFLGDIKQKAGINKLPHGKAYAEVYDAIDDVLGKKAITELLSDVCEADIEVINWPNVTNLDDAEYEIVFYPDDQWAESLMEETADDVAVVLQSVFS